MPTRKPTPKTPAVTPKALKALKDRVALLEQHRAEVRAALDVKIHGLSEADIDKWHSSVVARAKEALAALRAQRAANVYGGGEKPIVAASNGEPVLTAAVSQIQRALAPGQIFRWEVRAADPEPARAMTPTE